MKAPVKLKPTQAYLDQKAALRADRHRLVELIEEGISADPHSPVNRRPGRGGRITDYSEAPGLYVTFRLLDEENAELMALLDLMP